jgi:hypothetical protein
MGFKASLKSIVGTVAPLLGASLGGPLGGITAKFLADKFTGGETQKLEEYFLEASPEDLRQLKEAELEFKKHMADLGIQQEQLEVADRADARMLAREKGLKVQAILSASYTTGYFITLLSFVFGLADVDAEYTEMVTVLIGALSAPQLQILNFWFGSSKGSSDKTALLKNEIPEPK